SVALAAAANNADTVTIAVAAWPSDIGKSVELVVPIPETGRIFNGGAHSSPSGPVAPCGKRKKDVAHAETLRHGDGKKKEKGKSEWRIEVATGMIPSAESAKSENGGNGVLTASGWLSTRGVSEPETAEFADGVFRRKVTLRDLTVIRLERVGGKAPKRIVLSDKPPRGLKRPRFKTGVAKVFSERPSPVERRVPLIDLKRASSADCRSGAFSSETVAASRGRVGKISGVVPWDSKSIVVIHESGGGAPPEGAAWAKIAFKRPPADAETLSFWVRPSKMLESGADGTKKSKRGFRGKNQTVTLRFSHPVFKSGGGVSRRVVLVKLPSNVWSRIESRKPKNSPLPDELRILPPPKSKKRRGRRSGAEIETRYEFNGICALGGGSNALRSARLVSAGTARRPAPRGGDDEPDGGEKKRPPKMEERSVKLLLLFGKAGKPFEYRRTFSEPMVFRSAKVLTKFGKRRLAWRVDAQLLEVAGIFPERKRMDEIRNNENDDGTVAVVPEAVRSKLNARERKFLSTPNTSLIVIRLESLK
ncbi:MAG: hypothetical protein GXP32_10485, partial [Kiritimatiellaeota bacterium]|nr:hypothetical protein [Kiritimatiellota bacterium]